MMTILRGRSALGVPLAATLLAGTATAQLPPPQTFHLDFDHDSGFVQNDTPTRSVVISFPVFVQGANSLRVHFDEVLLAGEVQRGNHSILRITSWKDGQVHELDPIEAKQWQNSSAYMNGDTVQVEVVAFPDSGPNRVSVDQIEAGMIPPQLSQCGPTDDRTPSADPRAARALPIGCTAWIFDDCNHCLGTAGHCIGGSSTIQFNVPPSNANGSLNHPPPSDQYSTDFSSDQGQNAGIGFDWAYFGVFPNSNTGLTPAEAQNAWYTLAPTMPAFNPNHTIRITGYGVDSGVDNQAQQTHSGPWFDLTGTDVEHQADTTGGNSGSAVLNETLGVVIGVHTHAGCSTFSGNHGTGINSVPWQNALANPLGVCAAPCGFTATYCTGKVHSEGCTAQIQGVGTPSINSAPGDFVIRGTQLLGGKAGLLVYSFAPDAVPFFGGTLCVAAPLRRTPAQTAVGAFSACAGVMSLDFGQIIASGQVPGLTVGADVYAQWLQRDPLGAGGAITVSNATSFQVEP